MSRRLLFIVVVAVCVTGLSGLAVAAPTPSPGPPSGERINGGNGSSGGTVIEPVYDDMTGQIRYVSTPRGTNKPDGLPTNPRATAPFYLPVYPTGFSLANSDRLNCEDVPENCPDHGAAVAAAAEGITNHIYGTNSVYRNGVIGHDHLMAGPGSGGDFNVAWVPTLVLFTPSAHISRITTLDQLRGLITAGSVITVPLDGTNGTPNLTFHCSVVSAAVYDHSVPFTG